MNPTNASTEPRPRYVASSKARRNPRVTAPEPWPLFLVAHAPGMSKKKARVNELRYSILNWLTSRRKKEHSKKCRPPGFHISRSLRENIYQEKRGLRKILGARKQHKTGTVAAYPLSESRPREPTHAHKKTHTRSTCIHSSPPQPHHLA